MNDGPRFDCRLYGLDVVSDLDLHARRPRRGEPDVRVRAGAPVTTGDPHADFPDADLSVRWTTDSGLTASFWSRRDGSQLLRFEATCDIEIDAAGTEVTVHPCEGVPAAMGGVLVGGTVLSYLLMLRGLPVLHASAVDMGGRAVGFVGSSGMGKSTMATLMCRDGGLLITDDVLTVRPLDDVDTVGCALGATELRLRAAAAGLVDDFADNGSHRPTADDRHALSVPVATADDVPLTALLIPRPNRETSELALTRLQPLAAAMTLLSFPRILGVRDQQLIAAQFQQMTQLARTVPVFVADVPWGPPFEPELGLRLMAELDRHVEAPCPAT